jgi:hypothetical protein
VLRIEMEVKGLPGGISVGPCGIGTDYQYIRWATETILLPRCMRDRAASAAVLCSRNVIDFRNYHKYGRVLDYDGCGWRDQRDKE